MFSLTANVQYIIGIMKSKALQNLLKYELYWVKAI